MKYTLKELDTFKKNKIAAAKYGLDFDFIRKNITANKLYQDGIIIKRGNIYWINWDTPWLKDDFRRLRNRIINSILSKYSEEDVDNAFESVSNESYDKYTKLKEVYDYMELINLTYYLLENNK